MEWWYWETLRNKCPNSWNTCATLQTTISKSPRENVIWQGACMFYWRIIVDVHLYEHDACVMLFCYIRKDMKKKGVKIDEAQYRRTRRLKTQCADRRYGKCRKRRSGNLVCGPNYNLFSRNIFHDQLPRRSRDRHKDASGQAQTSHDDRFQNHALVGTAMAILRSLKHNPG